LKIELRAERAQNLDIPQPVDVDPRDAFVVEMRKQLLAILRSLFFKMGSIVLDEGDDQFFFSVDRFVARPQCAGDSRNRTTQLEHESREWLRVIAFTARFFPAPGNPYPERAMVQNVTDEVGRLRGTDRRGFMSVREITDRLDFGRGRTGSDCLTAARVAVALHRGGF